MVAVAVAAEVKLEALVRLEQAVEEAVAQCRGRVLVLMTYRLRWTLLLVRLRTEVLVGQELQ